jgi:hypothetical protein
MIEFFKTMMGQRFFEGTMPNLVRELARLNENLEKQRELSERMLASAEAQDKYQRDLDAKNFHCDGCAGDCQTNHGLTVEGECGDPDLRGPHPRVSDAGCHECIKAANS